VIPDVRRTGRRYELLVDGEVAAYADYTDDGTTVVIPHVVTEPAFRNRGLATALVTAAFEDLRGRGRLVVPACPFAAAFVRSHPEWADLVAP
jgi:predicted GNAT family acetyltransferase